MEIFPLVVGRPFHADEPGRILLKSKRMGLTDAWRVLLTAEEPAVSSLPFRTEILFAGQYLREGRGFCTRDEALTDFRKR